MGQTAVLSPINSYLWPIPVPNPLVIERQQIWNYNVVDYGYDMQQPVLLVVKNQLTQRDIEYCWLDILCLRQPGGIREQQRSPEWEIDVPTIGNIYRNAHTVVRYLNGLGQQVKKYVEAWKESRHWINRAWTLQEIKPDDQMSTPDRGGELHLIDTVRGTDPPKNIRQLLHPVSQLAATAHSPRGCGIIPLVRQIIGRSASNPLDQVAGINYLMWPKGSQFDLPIYNTDMSIDSSWLKCVDSMRLELKLELLFLYPDPRDDKPVNYCSKPTRSEVLRSIPQWVPTWKQLSSFTADSFWDQLRLPTLSELRLASTEHPLQVPTYLSNPKVLFGTFVLQDCYLSYIRALSDEELHLSIDLRSNPRIVFRGYAPMGTVFFPEWRKSYLLGLSLDIQAPWLVCHNAFTDDSRDECRDEFTGDIHDAGVPSIVAGITVYPRTLVLRKKAVLWTDDRQLLARTFPQTMPWPKRDYDAIYII